MNPSAHTILSPMETTNSAEVVQEFFPFFKVFKDGRIERFWPVDKVTASDDPETGLRSKDVTISPETASSARIFLPKPPNPTEKLPLLLYIHGGGFSIASAFSSGYNNYVKSLATAANIIVVSVEYRLAPEHPIPACYDDAYDAIQWIASHASGSGPDPWLNEHADFNRVFVAGDSAGANISHTTLVRVGPSGLPGVKIVGMALVHPFFGGTEDDKMWMYLCPEHGGVNDRRLKPPAEDLAELVVEKVVVFVAGEDHLKERGVWYYEELKKSGWKGRVEVEEHEGERHVFHLFNPDCEKAKGFMDRLVLLFNEK